MRTYYGIEIPDDGWVDNPRDYHYYVYDHNKFQKFDANGNLVGVVGDEESAGEDTDETEETEQTRDEADDSDLYPLPSVTPRQVVGDDDDDDLYPMP